MPRRLLAVTLLLLIVLTACQGAGSRQPARTIMPVSATDMPQPEPTSTPVPTTDTPQPEPTSTPVPATDMPQPELTSTPVPATDTPLPEPTSTPTPVVRVPQPTSAGSDENWILVFADEFEGSTLDSSVWATCYWWDDGGCTNAGNDELEWYRPDDVLVNGGALKLRAQRRTVDASDGKTYSFTSGMVTSGRRTSDQAVPAGFAFLYGYAEIRAQVPSGKGLWSAFWLLPADHLSKPEIDVMEVLGDEADTVSMHFHQLTADGGRTSLGEDWAGPDMSADWHTFAVDWRPDSITWYIDGIERWRYTDSANVPAKPMYLILNLAVGGVWPGAPDGSTPFPSTFQVDYVRVWSEPGEMYLSPIADAYVDSDRPSTSFGSRDMLYVDGDPARVTYLKFDTTALAQGTVAAARLRIMTAAVPGADSPDAQTVRLVSDTAWDQSTLTYESRPLVLPGVLGTISNTLASTAYEIPLDVELLRPYVGNVFSLALDSDGEDGLYFYSRDNAFGNPQLIIGAHDRRVATPVTGE